MQLNTTTTRSAAASGCSIVGCLEIYSNGGARGINCRNYPLVFSRKSSAIHSLPVSPYDHQPQTRPHQKTQLHVRRNGSELDVRWKHCTATRSQIRRPSQINSWKWRLIII